MISELKNYYFNSGILSTNFHCKHFDQCRQGESLITGKSAFVGIDYEKHVLPRILFVSLDPGSDHDFETSEKRSPEGVRQIESNRHWQNLPPLLHWFTTHKIAHLIGQQFNQKLTSNEVNQIFAHTNCTKCCEVKKSNSMSSAILYKNCSNYLTEEFEILDPDILIGQGNEAQKAIEKSFTNISNEPEFQKIINIHERIRILEINNHPVLYIKFIYPSWRNDRTRIQEKELYPYYLSAVNAFKSIIRIIDN